MRHLLFAADSGRLLDDSAGDPIAHWQGDPGTFLWLDLDGSDPEAERALMLDAFGLHRLAVNDALRDRHPPKVEMFPESLFLLLRGLDATSDSIEFGTIQIAVFAGERFLLTRHSGPSSSTDWLFERARGESALVAAGSQRLALELMNRVVRRYVPILLDLEPRLETLEDEIFAAGGRNTDAVIEELARYKSRLKRMRRLMAYHQTLALELKALRGHGLDAKLSHEINDIGEQLHRAVTLSDLYVDLAGDLVNAYLAIASHRLNQIFRVLTIITVIFVPLSFLAGIYGMNFEHMPELAVRGAYFVLLGVMAAIVCLQLWLFHRIKWL
jgi:magnesium transporter